MLSRVYYTDLACETTYVWAPDFIGTSLVLNALNFALRCLIFKKKKGGGESCFISFFFSFAQV